LEFVLGSLLLLTACQSGAPGAEREGAPTVVSTVGMLGDVTREVGGDCIEVTTLMGPGVDPHLYQPGARDVRTLFYADAILFVGYGLEGQLGRILERLEETRPTVAVAEAAVPPALVIRTDDAYGVDPHLWMDVSLWARTVDVIARTLGDLVPNCADEMRARAHAYRRQLEALHRWVERSLATVPEAQRVLVTAHDAFAYYGRAYDLEVVGIQGISTESEAAIRDIQSTVDLVVERRVPAIFVESSVNARTIRAVLAAARSRGVRLEVGSELYSDALGDAGTPEGTYIGMIHHNTLGVTRALGGAPAPLPEALRGWAEAWNLEAR